MNFNIADVTYNYQRNHSPYRELAKYLFSICTFGLGALWFAATTIVVREGQIGVREDARGKITLLPPGRHSNFPWESYPAPVQDLSQSVIKLGPYTIITVPTGSVAQTIDKGILTILEAGQHLLLSADHIFKSFMSIKQETEELKKIQACTNDGVELDIEADVQYEIENPELAISKVDDINKSIKETAANQLNSVIGSHPRQELIPAATKMDTSPALKEQTKDLTGEAKSANLQNNFLGIENEVYAKAKDRLAEQGIKLIKVFIKNISIVDKALAHELGQAAVIQSQTNSKLINAKSDAEILRISSEAKAKAIQIEAKATADAAKLLNDTPLAKEIVVLNKHIEMVGSAKPGTQLNYGATGYAGFFPFQHEQASSNIDQINPHTHQNGL